MKKATDAVKHRPTETATAGGGVLAAVIVALTGADPAAAALIAAAVGGLPAVVTTIVTSTRQVTDTKALVDLTGDVAETVKEILGKARTSADLKLAAEALQSVAATVAAWSELLASQPAGTEGRATSNPNGELR